MTFLVITGLLAFVILDSSISHGMTSSSWYFRRNATLVTSLGGKAEAGRSPRFDGKTVQYVLTNCAFKVGLRVDERTPGQLITKRMANAAIAPLSRKELAPLDHIGR